MADQGQAETEAAVRARAGAVALAEPVEDVGQDDGIDARAGVGDDDLDARSPPGEPRSSRDPGSA